MYQLNFNRASAHARHQRDHLEILSDVEANSPSTPMLGRKVNATGTVAILRHDASVLAHDRLWPRRSVATIKNDAHPALNLLETAGSAGPRRQVSGGRRPFPRINSIDLEIERSGHQSEPMARI